VTPENTTLKNHKMSRVPYRKGAYTCRVFAKRSSEPRGGDLLHYLLHNNKYAAPDEEALAKNQTNQTPGAQDASHVGTDDVTVFSSSVSC
jgi:hypothetical protein